MDLFDIAVASKLAGGGGGGGGGASNIISGEFTAQASEGVQTIIIPYEGTGYPIIVRIVAESMPALVDENNGFMVAFVGLSKYIEQTPTYHAGYYDKMVIAGTYITPNTKFETTNGTNATIYSRGTPARTGWSGVVLIKSATEINVNVETSGTSGWVGFRANTKYRYEVVYSS